MGGSKCCVLSCKNTTNNSQYKFYRFPTIQHKLIQRERWISIVRQQNGYDRNWQPTTSQTICSAHFIGDKKGEEVLGPNYVPTIFSPVSLEHKLKQYACLNRHERFIKRFVQKRCFKKRLQKRLQLILGKKPISSENELHVKSEIAADSMSENEYMLQDESVASKGGSKNELIVDNKPTSYENEIYLKSEIDSISDNKCDMIQDESSKCDKACQVDIFVHCDSVERLLCCNRFIFGLNSCDAETQTEINVPQSELIINIKKEFDQECDTPSKDLVDAAFRTDFPYNDKTRFEVTFIKDEQ
uniref:Uncharacterized protein LOC114339726 n=1 Tax=Diabrotica virgifera virgifera TaxID=50390 RepID=A0A6P7GJR9_DIAVI